MKATQLLHERMLDDVVIGGSAMKLGQLTEGCRLGDDGYAFLGGFRTWEEVQE